MYSSTGIFFVSALCVLLLPYYVAGELQIKSCKKEDLSPGAISMGDINVDGNTIKSSTMEIKQEINTGLITVQLTIKNEDGDSVMEQNIDFCSMSSMDTFKPYFQSFSQSEFNEGNCPINPGTYNSGDFQIRPDGGDGDFTVNIDVKEGPTSLFYINCEVKLE
ncbi:uncharacterized protein V1478_002672 [Vespula squamosa]|uniref:MD-2-related lipid-recognition domain-containing protein n=1 Tax=Vespula squamosa TaxID=30214 RepID=A0ABD2BT82_VESSQ